MAISNCYKAVRVVGTHEYHTIDTPLELHICVFEFRGSAVDPAILELTLMMALSARLTTSRGNGNETCEGVN